MEYDLTFWGLYHLLFALETTLESGIDVAPWINIASGKFDKKKINVAPWNVQTYVVNFKSFKSGKRQ